MGWLWNTISDIGDTIGDTFVGGDHSLLGTGSGIVGSKTQQLTSGGNLNQQKSDALWNLLMGGNAPNRSIGGIDPDGSYGRSAGSAFNPQTWLGMAQGLQGQLNTAARDNGAGMWNNFQSLLGGNKGILSSATNVANAANQLYGQNAMDYARALSKQTVDSMAAGMGHGGLFDTQSGPVIAALSQGAQMPLMQALTQMSQNYGNNLMGAYAPMAQQAYSNASGLTNRLATALQGAQTTAQPLLALLGQQAAPDWYNPTYQQGSSVLQGLLGGAAQGAGQGLGWQLAMA